MVAAEQLTIDRETPSTRVWTEERAAAERAARESLRSQVARLEGELSGIVARGFPHISPAPFAAPECAGPRLLSLAELERARDRLVVRMRRAQEHARERAELEFARAISWNGCGWNRAATSSCACASPTSANVAAACGRCVPASA